jgi:hypothetical protein
MYRVRRIGVISAANVTAAISLVITLFFVLLVALVVLPMGSFPVSLDPANPFSRNRMGGGSIVGFLLVLPLVYAAIGWAMGALGALVYNLVARFIGGLQLDLEHREPQPAPTWAPPPTEAAPPPAGSAAPSPPNAPYDSSREG